MSKKPITLEELEQIASGEVIDIPSHDGRGTIAVRVKRIDMTSELLNSEMLSNELIGDVVKQFDRGKSQQQVEQQLKAKMVDADMSKIVSLVDKICVKALVEPTFEQFEEFAPLNLNQKMAIFNWIMEEVRGMKPFRKQSGHNSNANRQRKDMGKKA